MSELKNLMQERKVDKNNIVEKKDLDFSSEIFTKNDPETNEFLISKTLEAVRIQVKSSLVLGKLFTEVFDRLSGSNRYDGLYEKWIEVSGYNKRTALRHRNRFELYNEVNEDKRALVATLPIRMIEEIYRNIDRQVYIEFINDGVSKEELFEILFKTPEEPKVIEYEKDELDSEIIGKVYIFNKLNSENLKNLSESKKKKIENYLKKIEELLGESSQN